MTDHSQHEKEAKERILADVKKSGYYLALLEPDNYLPGFVYSIGLFKTFGHPEIICFGLPGETLWAVVDQACDLIQAGETLVPGKLYEDFLEGYRIQFLPVQKEHSPDYLGYGGWFYKSFDFPVLQLVWPDKQNNFPWKEGFSTGWKFKQPLLDRNTDFKFYEERNLGVYTSRQAFEGDPILYVYHNEDGDWQFHTSAEPDIKDVILVSLEEITKLDATINHLYHLQFGWRAWRDNREADWEYEECDTDESS